MKAAASPVVIRLVTTRSLISSGRVGWRRMSCRRGRNTHSFRPSPSDRAIKAETNEPTAINHWVTGMGSRRTSQPGPLRSICHQWHRRCGGGPTVRCGHRQIRLGQRASGLAAKEASGQRGLGLEGELAGVATECHLVAAPGDAPLSVRYVESG